MQHKPKQVKYTLFVISLTGCIFVKLKIEQSDTEFYTPTAGLYFVGHAINQNTTLKKTLRSVIKRHGIPNIELVRTYIGLLATGKNDFEAVENIRDDDWFKLCMGIGQMPSTSRLRQRFDEDAKALKPLIDDSLTEIVVNLDAPVTPLPSRLDKHQHIALDIDVFPMDNSGTSKEGVARTYKGHDGYAPIASYLGQEGWSLGCELRIGSQHSQKEFTSYLDQVIRRARRITHKPLLLRLDSGHDAEESRREAAHHKHVDYIIKLNPRRSHTTKRWLPCFEEADVTWYSIRDGKDYATLSVIYNTDYGQQRLVLRIIRRTCDAVGQLLLLGPDYELEGWWTTLEEEHYSDDDIIALYEDHATSEQFHSEFKTDLDLERLPSGKFATNALVMSLAALTYNILRCMGQKALLGPDSPVRHSAKRRRLKTVMQELIYQAARLVKSGRQYLLRFSRHSPGYRAYSRLLSEYALC